MTAVLDPASPSHSNQLISTKGKIAKRVECRGIPENVRDSLMKMARMGRDERCGFITNNWEIYPILNSHSEPTHNFFMDKEDVQDALSEIYEKRGEHIIAIWHTHPNNVPWPSPRDICGWPNVRLGWRYLIATGGDVLEWMVE